MWKSLFVLAVAFVAVCLGDQSPLCSSPAIITVSNTSINTNVGSAHYSLFQSCVWTVNAPAGKYPTITFTAFNIAYYTDYFNVYDGTSDSSDLLLQASGNALPATTTGTQQSFYITFTSDGDTILSGVTAVITFSDVPGGFAPAPCNPQGTYVITTPTNISTNGEDTTYDDGETCTWTINAPPGYLPLITFTRFDTEEEFDFFDVYQGSIDDGTQLLHRDGASIPDPIIGTGPYMTLQFSSDEYFDLPGVAATITFLPIATTTTTTTPDPLLYCNSAIITDPFLKNLCSKRAHKKHKH